MRGAWSGACTAVLVTPLFAAPLFAAVPALGQERAEAAALARLDLEAATFVVLVLPDAAIACDVVVPLDGHARTLRLWPHDVRSSGFALLVHDGDVATPLATPPSVTMRGVVLDAPGLESGGRVAGALVDGAFEGLVRLGDEVHGIQPARELGFGVHAVYSAQDLAPLDVVCGVPDSASSVTQFHDRLRRTASASLTFTAELAVDCDYEFYLQNGGSTTATQNDVTNVLNTMDGIFTAQVGMDHLVTTIVVRTSNNDPYSAFEPSNLLGQFQAHWLSAQQAVPRDSAHLFTGKNLNGSTIGIANLSGVCNGLGYALSQSRFTSNFSRRVALTAHEMGHNLSALHCNQASSCHIMCSSIAGCGPISSFAPTSVASIVNFRNSRDCLDVSSPPIITSVTTTLEALTGDALTVVGCHFTSLASLSIGGDTFSINDPRVTVLDDGLLEIVPPTIAQLGATDLVASGPGGDSVLFPVDVVATDPPRLLVANDSFGAYPMRVDWGAPVGRVAFVYYQLNDPSTLSFQGFDLLANPLFTGFSAPVDAAGLGSLSVVVPPFVLFQQTLYLQVICLGNGALLDVTPVVSTYFQI
ncbi:MAG: M12 family metallo-peptidase [Planctomycetota bacterium]